MLKKLILNSNSYLNCLNSPKYKITLKSMKFFTDGNEQDQPDKTFKLHMAAKKEQPKQRGTSIKNETKVQKKMPVMILSKGTKIEEKKQDIHIPPEDIQNIVLPEKADIPNILTENKIFSDYLKILRNSTHNSFRNAYLNTIRMMISNKISVIEKELVNLKQSGGDNKFDNKIRDEKIEKGSSQESSASTDKDLSESESYGEFKTIFAIQSIKEVENSIKVLPFEQLSNIKFKYSLLRFYSERNIDKAFEYFYDNLKDDRNYINDDFLVFLKKCVTYDKTNYVCNIVLIIYL
jgi:hypothetical protein